MPASASTGTNVLTCPPAFDARTNYIDDACDLMPGHSWALQPGHKPSFASTSL